MLYYWIPTWFESLTLQGVQISYVLSCWFTAVWGLGGCLGGSSIIGGGGGFQYNRGGFSIMGEEGGFSIMGEEGGLQYNKGGGSSSIIGGGCPV